MWTAARVAPGCAVQTEAGREETLEPLAGQRIADVERQTQHPDA